MWIISTIALSIVIGLCLLGIWHRSFHDNLLQCLGMAWLIVACVGRMHWLLEHQAVDPSWMLVHIGMAIYALGTATKVAVRHGRDCGWPVIAGFDRWLQVRKTGAGEFDDRPHHHH